MPMSLKRQRGVGRCVLYSFIFASIAIGLVAVSRATDPQDSKALPAASTPQGEVAIRNLLRDLTNAYNQADARGLGDRFTDDAILFHQDGSEVRGRDSIGRYYAEAFSNGPTCKIAGEVDSVHFLAPDVASVAGRFQLVDEKGTALFREI